MAQAAALQTAGALDGRRVLVVEDDFIIAVDLVDVLAAAGAVPLGPVGWPEDALRLIRAPDTPLDCAVLDIDLHGDTSFPIADALIARHVPFVFTSGFGPAGIDPAYAQFPRLEKPVGGRALVETLRRLCPAHGGDTPRPG